MSNLTANLPREQIVIAMTQHKQAEAFIDELYDEAMAVNRQNMKLREKIKSNLNSADRRLGFLNHEGMEYYSCLPIIHVKKLKTLLEEDRSVWKQFHEKASVKATKVAEEIARLQEEQRKMLEKLIQESQANLLEIPEIPLESEKQASVEVD